MHERLKDLGSLISNSIIYTVSISRISFFFKSILSRKNWQGGGELLLKIGPIDSDAY